MTALAQFTGRNRQIGTTSAALAASFNSIGHLRVGGVKAPLEWAPMSGFHRTRDGWVRLHANYPHHAARLLKALEIENPSQLSSALLELDAVEAEARIGQARGIGAAVRSAGDWAATPMSVAAAAPPWIAFDTTTAAITRRRVQRPTVAGGPLQGVRVLDFTRVIAGPSASRLLGALGADVLRVDPPHLPELEDHHVDTGFAKRSALADLRNVNDRSQIHSLLESADIALLGYRSGSLDGFGLAPAALQERHPKVAVVSINAWGTSGPWARGRGFDSIVQAACGIADVYGVDLDGGRQPGALPVQALDHATGFGMAAAAVALLSAREDGAYGGAHLSLASTANALLDAPSIPSDDRQTRLPVRLQTIGSPYGDLHHVPPPIGVGGPADYPSAPVLYGSSSLDWEPSTQ